MCYLRYVYTGKKPHFISNVKLRANAFRSTHNIQNRYVCRKFSWNLINKTVVINGGLENSSMKRSSKKGLDTLMFTWRIHKEPKHIQILEKLLVHDNYEKKIVQHSWHFSQKLFYAVYHAEEIMRATLNPLIYVKHLFQLQPIDLLIQNIR